MRTSSIMVHNSSEVGVNIEEYDSVNKNYVAYEEMKDMFCSIKNALKLQSNATFTDTLKAAKKALAKKVPKEKVDKKKLKNRTNPGKIALNKTKIDLAP